jgi:hypothetical protein
MPMSPSDLDERRTREPQDGTFYLQALLHRFPSSSEGRWAQPTESVPVEVEDLQIGRGAYGDPDGAIVSRL